MRREIFKAGFLKEFRLGFYRVRLNAIKSTLLCTRYYMAILRGHPSGRRRGDPSWLERVTITGKHVLGINYHPSE